MDQRPDPLVPAEVDLRGLEYMPLLGARLYGSDFNLDASDLEFRVGLRLWWASWNQVPAGSLPSQDNRLCKLAGLEEAAAKWRKVRTMALHGFIECADGRLYHPVIAEQALIAWEKRAEHVAEQQNSNERKRRDREERRAMFEALRAVGVVPAWDTKKDDLRRLYAAHVTQPVTPPVTVTGHAQVTPPVTVTETARTGRDGTGRNTEYRDPAGASTVAAHTRAGQAVLRMKAKGLTVGLSPSHPKLLALLQAGITDDELADAAADAVSKGKPFAYALATAEGRRRDAAASASLPRQQVRRSATDRQVATINALTGKEHTHGRPDSANDPADVVDVEARDVR